MVMENTTEKVQLNLQLFQINLMKYKKTMAGWWWHLTLIPEHERLVNLLVQDQPAVQSEFHHNQSYVVTPHHKKDKFLKK